jgi:hypothetical protein
MRQTAFLAIFFTTAIFLPAADPTLLNMIMPDAKVLAGVNVSKAETSQFGQYLLRSMPADKGFQQFITTSGFDPRTDVQEILAASNTAAKSGLVLARGKFNAAMISSAALATGQFTTSSYSGAQLITPANGVGETMAIVLDTTPSTIAMVGDLANVKAALDRRKLSNPVNPVLAAKIAVYSAADAWSVSIAPLSSGGGAGHGNPMSGMVQGDMFKKVQAISGGITFSSPIQVTGEAVADSPQDASALGDVIKFVASMVQSSQSKGAAAGAEVSAIVQTLDVTTVQNTVRIALSIPEADLENLVQGAKGHKAGII